MAKLGITPAAEFLSLKLVYILEKYTVAPYVPLVQLHDFFTTSSGRYFVWISPLRGPSNIYVVGVFTPSFRINSSQVN